MATSPSLDILFFARPLLVLIVPAKVPDFVSSGWLSRLEKMKTWVRLKVKVCVV
ncbi:hypothetical protein SCLCIDRAFT_1211171 [Scleroderma citrinum Foug A]|uniref:Uncharacterized protein n=1 Tax=Scleroderma citrinum Foug A TaxID=1036808 RepID=A0A0C2ZY94_9AGAM|nr:hypothetical protein SCLCIDRAFT_1211171 [Scleroderma citrinum Foug A]